MPHPAEKITLLCLDVDGVLTDGSIFIDDHGVETKRFHVRDGTGISIWRKLGYEVAIVTGRSGMALRHRAAELGIRHVIQGVRHKADSLRLLLSEVDMNASATAWIGDDLPDLPAMRLVGYPIAVADAVAEIKAVAAYVTILPGGVGAVREAIEHMLKAKNQWDDALQLIEDPLRW